MPKLITHDEYMNEDLGVEIIPVYTGDAVNPTLKESEYEPEKITLFRARSESEKDVLFVGLGNKCEITPYKLRCAGGVTGKFIRENKYESALLSPVFNTGAGEFAEGFLLGSYVFDRYKSREKSNGKDIILHSAKSSVSEADAEKIRAMTNGAFFARDLVNMSSNELYPHAFAEIAAERFADTDVKVKVYNEEEFGKEGFAGVAAVGRGGGHKPCYLELTYKTDETKPLLALIGKGVTFDMGGMNVKTCRDLSGSRGDMSGAAAVAGAFDIIRSLRLKANIAGLIPLAENLPGSRALLPGTVVTYPQGTTVEVCNTDCEGRMILADAILHAGRLGAECVIDIATLTGNIGTALGNRMSGIWGDGGLCNVLVNIGDALGDKLWKMPLPLEYNEYIKSNCADIRNLPTNNNAGAITAALFLKHFVKDNTAWAHIDMAATAMINKPYGYLPKGASGYGARLLAQYVVSL